MSKIKIVVNNSYSQVIGLTTPDFNALKKVLSYSIDAQAAYFSKNMFNTRKYLIDKHGNFPTGLLSIALKALSHIKPTIVDNRVKPNTLPKPRIMNSKVKPYPDQAYALNAAITKHHGTLTLPTGTGKSLIIALITAKLNVRTLIVVPNLEIKKQLTESFESMFADMSNITIENIDSTSLKKVKNYGCLIIDEAHHSAAATYQRLNKTAWEGIYYRFFFTATPFRSNEEENILFQAIAGEVIYSLSYKKAIENKYIVPIEAYYIQLPKVDVVGYTWQQVYNELVTNNEYRNELIANLLYKLSDFSTLCLVKEIKHGDRIAELASIPFVNGQDDETRHLIKDFNQGDVKQIIGTTGVIGEGVDSRPAEYIIIACLGKAKSAFMQQVGRGVRKFKDKESAKVIIFKDPSHKFTVRHFNEQKKILEEEYGAIVQKIEI